MNLSLEQTVTPSNDMLSIARLVPRGSRVLDLGCGTGELLDYLIKRAQLLRLRSRNQ